MVLLFDDALHCLNCLKLVRVVSVEEQAHVSFIGRTDGAKRAAAFILVLFDVLVVVMDLRTILDKSIYLQIQVINYHIALMLPYINALFLLSGLWQHELIIGGSLAAIHGRSHSLHADRLFVWALVVEEAYALLLTRV